MSIIETKEEDAYAERKPKGIQKEGEEQIDEEEDYEIDLNENCYTLRKTAAFTLSRFSSNRYTIHSFRNLQ